MKCGIDKHGTKRWYNMNRKLHRDGGLHAIEFANGDKHWYVNGKQHRDGDLPAIEDIDGDKHWYINGTCHRDGGLPAMEFFNGFKAWQLNGEYHRLGGLPAVEYANGNKAWYIYDNPYSYYEVCNYYKILSRFGRYCLMKIRIRRRKRVRWIHSELLCMPPKIKYLGGQHYLKMVNCFINM